MQLSRLSHLRGNHYKNLHLQEIIHGQFVTILSGHRLPNVPFRVVTTGQDEDGLPFRRQFPVFRSQTVAVDVEYQGSNSVPAGMTTNLSLNIKCRRSGESHSRQPQ